jgi:hypothetical protein
MPSLIKYKFQGTVAEQIVQMEDCLNKTIS